MDKPKYKKEVNKVNKKLKNILRAKIFSHENIEEKHLNPYGIYLNKFGTAIMAKNFLSYLNNVIIYQVSKFIHSSILLVKRGSRESHEIQLLTA